MNLFLIIQKTKKKTKLHNQKTVQNRYYYTGKGLCM